PAGVELEIVEGDLLAGIEVAVAHGRALHRYAGDVEFHRSAAGRGLLVRLLVFLVRRRLVAGLLDQVLEVEAPVLALDDLRLDAAQAHAVDNDVAAQKREERDGGVGRFERKELLARVALRKDYARDLGPQARIERQLERSFKLQRSPGALLDDALDVVLVAVRVEGRSENCRRRRR